MAPLENDARDGALVDDRATTRFSRVRPIHDDALRRGPPPQTTWGIQEEDSRARRSISNEVA